MKTFGSALRLNVSMGLRSDDGWYEQRETDESYIGLSCGKCPVALHLNSCIRFTLITTTHFNKAPVIYLQDRTEIG